MAERINVRIVLRAAVGGSTPMLLHPYDVHHADKLKEWKAENDKTKADLSVPGDDRTPGWRWSYSFYTTLVQDKQGRSVEVLALPQDNVQAAMVSAGSAVKKWRGDKSGKHLATQGVGWNPAPAVLLVNGRAVEAEPMRDEAHQMALAMRGKPVGEAFKAQIEVAKRHGHGHIGLDVRPVVIPKSQGGRHIRVRPSVTNWSAEFLATVEPHDVDALRDVLDLAGHGQGLGDYRPGAPKKPGIYGKFDAEVEVLGKGGVA